MKTSVNLVNKLLQEKCHVIEKYTSISRTNLIIIKSMKILFLPQIILDYLLENFLQLPFKTLIIYKDDLICSVPGNNTQIILNAFNSFDNEILWSKKNNVTTNKSVI